MKTSFDILNEIFNLCINDTEMSTLLGIDSSLSDNKLLDEQNNKLRREFQTDEVIKSKDCPFISFYFLHAEKTKTNWLVNTGDLVIDIYTHNIYETELIANRLRFLIANNIYALLTHEGQHYSGVNGVYKYRLIYNPLIDGE